jgi:nucleoside-diphosphate-sugar epimerase
MSRRALLTGITGFIGGELAKHLLADGWQVDAIVRPQSDTACLPFADAATFHVVEDSQDLTPVLAAAKPDIVFHLASLYLAEHRPDQVDELVRSNVLFPALLVEAMAATGTRRLVNTGTAWQQFRGEAYMPVNLYAATKQAAENMLAYYADTGAISVITLRLFDTYGEGDKRRKLIQILIDAVRSGEPLAMSPGEQIVDMTHVDDVATAFLLAAEYLLAKTGKVNQVFYVSGERQNVRELATRIADTLGRSIRAEFGGRPYRAREVMMPYAPTADELVPSWNRRQSIETYLHAMMPGPA